MKKQLFTAVLAAQLMTQLYAGGDIEAVEPVEAEEPSFYVVVKGMAILGDDMTEEEASLSGDNGFGLGIDVGYRLGKGFAIEYDFSYSTNTVRETREGAEPEEYDFDYYTSALDLIYAYEATESLVLFAKVGYEYEWEHIDALDEKNTDHGAVFGVGMEIAINEDYGFVTEYEHSTIKGPRGDALFAGLLVKF